MRFDDADLLPFGGYDGLAHGDGTQMHTVTMDWDELERVYQQEQRTTSDSAPSGYPEEDRTPGHPRP